MISGPPPLKRFIRLKCTQRFISFIYTCKTNYNILKTKKKMNKDAIRYFMRGISFLSEFRRLVRRNNGVTSPPPPSPPRFSLDMPVMHGKESVKDGAVG